MQTFFDPEINDMVFHQSSIGKAVTVETLPDYRLLIGFSSGEKKIYDVQPLLSQPTFEPLSNKALFKQAHIDYGTVIWNDDLDLCPESLYRDSIPV